MIYLIQILAFVFAYACGRHDVPAVDNFTFYGSNKKHQKNFHGYNLVLKGCFLAVVYIGYGWQLTAICFLIINVVFDPVIAIFRTVYTLPKKPWYYLSENSNWSDKALLKVFGKKAGIWKTAICVLAIAVLNYFL